ncbi:sulfurtransferase complex subunit TusB [Prosthecochloris sp. N3]|uniref:Sulfurtransferase complex subunit TusB n=1 Tax=Prosthecochloris ethylica TaxID=2743976 RepID=A0ABR9XRZ2_9CHLB|nr:MULTISPECIES: sulfurtransferase complex subunit TusB [Prosthecochloris]MEC9487195.1 sulfurtransferase complex subunit TusB [Prosthecochloris sp.]MBF0585992.1 sulfurtransferase complex subunit TusB [Prosthecochloris ethylica]MBF0636608.1 sulfurtransferase complex subunit TusB [Prosthecochloris ethylica]NUK47240.1 sulfurtransferase complex subunit TusB [Prosthecochloris ethylica]RNA64042.1 sulfurtransferase complex subunit TusB [Prosthecochloris sp. ZM_2]
MLYTINKSPFETSTMQTALRFLQPGDPVLFIEDGVYAVQGDNRFSSDIAELMRNNPVYALSPDLEARGIGGVTDGVTCVGYDGFVELVEEHRTNTWL